MKTHFSRRTRPLSPAAGIALVVSGVLLLIVLVIRFVFPGVFASLTTPLFALGSGTTRFFSKEESAAALSAEVAALRAENETLRNENATLAARLRDVGDDTSDVIAGVLARPPMAPYDVLVIDRGTSDGVYDGMRAYALGVPIGLIESASVSSAKVVLYSAPGKTTEAWAGEQRIPVTLHGTGAGAYRADVPREAGVIEGDVIYLPGGGATPVGKVLRIESHPSAPRTTVFIQPLVNVFSLATVSVIANPAP